MSGTSNITISLLDYLFVKSNGRSLDDLDPNYVNNVRDIALESVFGHHANVIDAEFRDTFVTGFCLHFELYEFAHEVPAMWRRRVNATLVENAALINQTYAHINKQVFSNYSTRKIKGNGSEISENVTKATTEADVKSTNESLQTDRGDGKSKVADKSKSESKLEARRIADNSTVNSGKDVAAVSGTDKTVRDTDGKQSNTGTDKVIKGGSDKVSTDVNVNHINSGADQKSTGGEDSTLANNVGSTYYGKKDTKSGAATDTYLNMQVKKSGDVNVNNSSTTGYNGRETEEINRDYTFDSNAAQAGRQAIKDGVYLTSGSEDDKNKTTKERGSETTGGNTKTTDNSASTTNGKLIKGDNTTNATTGVDQLQQVNLEVKKHGGVETTRHGLNVRDAGNTTAITTNGGTEQTTHGLTTTDKTKVTDATTHGQVNTTAHGLKVNDKENVKNDDKTNVTASKDVETSDIRNYDTKVKGGDTKKEEGKSNSKVDGHVIKEDETLEESYDLNYEMLMLSQPLLNRVWRLFDPLFQYLT